MKTEFEVRILNINVEEITKKLKSLNAKFLGEKLQRRYVYNLLDKKDDSFLRLRTNGDFSTLTFKEMKFDGVDGTKEVEVKVSSFEDTKVILEKIGYFPLTYQENKRRSYLLDGVEIEIDFWPNIPAYLEVECKSKDDVLKTLDLIGFSLADSTTASILNIYKKYGIDLHECKELKFE